jgi:hypothetical protein
VLLITPVSTSFGWATMNEPAQSTSSQGQGQELLSADQLDSLVAPLALYPDPILSQVLVASTYPLEIVQASQWLNQNSSLSGKALADAAAQQPWDASVQALVMLPDLLHRLSKDIRWTSDVGDAFLAQEQDVMAAIQRMRQKAQQKGALQSNQQQTVNTTTANGQNYIVIEPAQPEVVYVPQYDLQPSGDHLPTTRIQLSRTLRYSRLALVSRWVRYGLAVDGAVGAGIVDGDVTISPSTTTSSTETTSTV